VSVFFTIQVMTNDRPAFPSPILADWCTALAYTPCPLTQLMDWFGLQSPARPASQTTVGRQEACL